MGLTTSNKISSKAQELFHSYQFRTAGFKKPKAYFNWALANMEMLRRKTRIKARPLKTTIDITNVCQLRCPLCPTGLEAHDRESTHFDFDKYMKLIDEIGDYLFFLDFYNWGEPLLHKRIEEFIQVARKKNISCGISTNLSLKLTDERIRKIINSGLNEMVVSVDGASQEVYEKYRRRGDFDLVITNMRRFVELKREMGVQTPCITWRYLVFGFNEHQIETARALSEEIGVDSFVVTSAYLDEGFYPVPESERKSMNDWQPTLPDYQLYSGQKEDGTFIPKYKPNIPNRCDWHYMSSAINADGNIAPCCALFSSENDFGTFDATEENSYMNVLNNDKYTAIRAKFNGERSESTELVCEKCPASIIMPYGYGVNRDVIFMTAVQFYKFFQNLFSSPAKK